MVFGWDQREWRKLRKGFDVTLRTTSKYEALEFARKHEDTQIIGPYSGVYEVWRDKPRRRR
jgi:hypothetical protein